MMKFYKAGFFAAFAACTVFTGALAGLSGSGILRSEPITAFAEELSLPLSNEAGGWSLSISDLECSASLSTVSTSLGYASVETRNLERTADEGYEFLLLKLSFKKQDSTESIAWDRLFLEDDSGNQYFRIDDSFLADYGMNRLPGTALNFGSYEGWICFQIPENTNDLTFVYPFASETLSVSLKELLAVKSQDTEAADSSDTASSESASETSSQISADSSQKKTWTRLETSDYLNEQRTVDYNLYQESKKNYSFQDPLIVVNPYGNSPLSAMVIFTTLDETVVDAVVYGHDRSGDISTVFPSATVHMLPIYGLYPGETTTVELTLDTGEYVDLSITAEDIDSVLTQAEVTAAADLSDESISDTAATDSDGSSSLTFVCVSTADGGPYGAAAYDQNGDLRWILKTTEGTVLPMKRLKNGRLMRSSSQIIHGNYYASGLTEFDLCGKYYTEYLIPGGQHHDFVELENGNLLVCSSQKDFSSVEDRIVEIDRKTGEVVYELNVSDLIDPSDGGSLNQTDSDWCHNNSIDYDPDTDTILLSCRHLDAVLGIEKSTSTLKWVLGDPKGFSSVPAEKFFTPVHTENGFEWQYAQHNASFLPGGDILLFDNGTHRTKKGYEDLAVTGDSVYSRAVRYHIDPESMTIEQVWSYGKERGREWYSSFISGVVPDHSDTYVSSTADDSNTFLITSGGIGYDAAEDTYDVTPAQAMSCEYHTCIDLVSGETLLHELSLPALVYRSFSMELYPQDLESSVESIYDRGTWLGDLGTVELETDHPDDIPVSQAAAVDFIISSMVQTPDRIQISGTWPETGTDAALVLTDETNTQYWFSIAPPAWQTSDTSMDFSIWITPASVPYSHRYRICLYNLGTLYNTWTFFDNYVDTSDEKNGRGPQKTLYDVDGNSLALTSSSAQMVSSDSDGISVEDSLPVHTQELTLEIFSELSSGTYTFEAPLIIQNPYEIAPLTALIAFETETSCQVRITVKGKTASADRTDLLDAASTHLVPVLGLYPDYENHILLELLDESGTAFKTQELTLQTEKLPEYLRTAVKTGSYTGSSSMDLMLISGLGTPYLYAFDEFGDIRWYCTLEREYYGGFPLENGHILTESPDVLFPNASMPNSPEFVEIDWLGRAYRLYSFPEGVHHEIKEKTPDGNLLIASSSNDGYEQNLIQEIDRETGAVVKSLCLNDVFEGLEYLNRDDWCHINTLSYDEKTDSILVSCRNLHSVIRINWSTDEIQWILGDPLLWEGTSWESKVLAPASDFSWHYQQHSAYELSQDLDGDPDTVEIMLFDNHNAQYQMLDDYSYTGSSYVKIYSVDPAAMTVTLLSNFETDYSSITSNAFADSSLERIFSVNAYITGKSSYKGRVYEFDRQTGTQINTWMISHKFYRGYPVSFSASECAEVFTLPDNYRPGTLRQPVEITEPVRFTGSGTLTEKSIQFALQENTLYLWSGDHLFTQVIFNGTSHTYAYDISDIKLISSGVNSFQYRLPIPLDGLAPDTYTVQIMYMNRLYNTTASFTVSEKS